ncbi:MAG: glycosyltransferase family 2 protein [Actinomycetota bacterium]|nr:glycosyltransferase family 2 protein [Actinomycetota bacterium]
MKVAPRVTLVVIAYGQPDLLEALLDSIADHTPEAHEILVVDNASPDDTYERAARHRTQPRLIKANRNLGYGGGANLGVRASNSDVVIIMNSDLEVTEGWLSPLLRPIETNSAVIAAPLYVDETDKVVESGASLTADGHVHPAQMASTGLAPVDHVSAACWAVKRTWFQRMGGFDPSYGLGYFEDVDLCAVAAANKEVVVVVNESRVVHRTGASFSSTAVQRLSHRNHARAETRWYWIRRGTQENPWPGETAICHGRVAVIGHHPKVVSQLRSRNISVAVLDKAIDLSHRPNRDDVVVAESELSTVAALAPRAEITTPEDLENALRRAGIAPSSTPPRPRFSSIATTRSRRW